MEKIFFSIKSSRLDTCAAVLFLSTRVREPENYDRAKLIHLMKYIRGTSNIPLTLSDKERGILKRWIVGSFTVHPKMRGRTGAGLSMVRGFPIFGSTKQNLNTQISTEIDNVSVDDCIPDVL